MSDSAILQIALVILGLPILSYVLIFFFGKKLPRQGDWIGVGLMGIAEVLSLKIFVHFWRVADPAYRVEGNYTWIDLGKFQIDAGILVDGMTAVMLVVVCTVSFVVHLFSVGYMQGDSRYDRFFAFLGFFTFSMFGIVLANNLFFLYVFWELVGLASYLLIGFFFYKHSAANANKKAFLANRVGDWGFWLGILTFFWACGTMNYFELFAGVHGGAISGSLLTWGGVLLFMGCLGKSAQMPLHIWLPDAMEGPTPVSALIHAATMVAAGVYMIARLVPLFSPEALLVIAYVGGITAFLAATIAVVKTDIKRSLAYSTLSQLGYMVMAVGVGASCGGMFHLTIHAFFKALLFLGSGSVIHAVHTQEMPEMGGLRHKMPITFVTMSIATLAISGVPFFAGFYSKDAILASALAFGMQNTSHMILFILTLAAAGITAFYMFRLIFLTFFGKPRDQKKYDHAHESPWTMTVPLLILGVLSFIGAGWQGPTSGWFSRFVVPYDLEAISAEFSGGAAAEHIVVAHETAHDVGDVHAVVDAHASHDAHEALHHKAHNIAMVCSILIATLGILLSWLTYIARRIDPAKIQARLSGAHHVLQNMYFFDEIYAATVYRGVLVWCAVCAAFDRYVIDGVVNGSGYLLRGITWFSGQIDRWVIDGLVNGVASIFQGTGEGLRRVQTGRLQTYLAFVCFSILLFVLVFRAL